MKIEIIIGPSQSETIFRCLRKSVALICHLLFLQWFLLLFFFQCVRVCNIYIWYARLEHATRAEMKTATVCSSFKQTLMEMSCVLLRAQQKNWTLSFTNTPHCLPAANHISTTRWSCESMNQAGLESLPSSILDQGRWRKVNSYSDSVLVYVWKAYMIRWS